MTSPARQGVAHRQWRCAMRLRERRGQLGLTQAEVADRLVCMGVDITNRTLSAMEHGRGVDVGRLPELAGALDCTITYLMGLTDDPHRWEPDHPLGPVSAEDARPAHLNWILGPT